MRGRYTAPPTEASTRTSRDQKTSSEDCYAQPQPDKPKGDSHACERTYWNNVGRSRDGFGIGMHEPGRQCAGLFAQVDDLPGRPDDAEEGRQQEPAKPELRRRQRLAAAVLVGRAGRHQEL